MPPSTSSTTRGRLSIVACESGRPFADRMNQELLEIMRAENPGIGQVLRSTEEVAFANGEVKTVVKENIRGDDVYVIQAIDDPLSGRSVNDNFMALLTAINAVYQSDPDSITAVIPQFPYSRQERKKAREAITARLVAAALEEAGANRVITLDIHAEAIEGFFRRAILEDLHASKELIAYFRSILPAGCEEELVVVAPDTGGAHMARHYSMVFGCGFAVVDKARDYSRASVVESMRLVGNVRGKRVLMPDDLIATGGTLINACRLLREEGAREIYVACSLPFFNGPAVERLDKAHAEGLFESVVGTDAVWRGEKFAQEHSWYREVSVANLFARVIFNINRRRSVSELLK
ncbi:MAG: ribose-phosphate pyrophosphokinase [Planctomycetes bacterium]|nr:ribose-phosphate pyrophosphokinase [Planctomycetota bacterium]